MIKVDIMRGLKDNIHAKKNSTQSSQQNKNEWCRSHSNTACTVLFFFEFTMFSIENNFTKVCLCFQEVLDLSWYQNVSCLMTYDLYFIFYFFLGKSEQLWCVVLCRCYLFSAKTLGASTGSHVLIAESQFQVFLKTYGYSSNFLLLEIIQLNIILMEL